MDFSGSVAGAYGSGKATGSFDPLAFIKKPQVILRLVSWLFSIIVFACIASEGWIVIKVGTPAVCQYNLDANACNYGTAIGVIAFLACIAFLLLDAMFDNFSNIKTRRFAVIADFAFSALWTFLWFVGFCYLTDQWRKAQETRPDVNPSDVGRNQMQAAIAFSFFSIGTWAALAVLAFIRYRQGITSDFQGGFGDDAFQAGGQPATGAGPLPPQGPVDAGYHQAPFSTGAGAKGAEANAGGAYQQQQQPFDAPSY